MQAVDIGFAICTSNACFYHESRLTVSHRECALTKQNACYMRLRPTREGLEYLYRIFHISRRDVLQYSPLRIGWVTSLFYCVGRASHQWIIRAPSAVN